MAVTLQRKATPLTGWHLVDQTDMLEVLSALAAHGWRGAISFDSSKSVWRLELNADNPTRQVIANTGDWLVDDMGVRLLTDAQFSANYEVTGS